MVGDIRVVLIKLAERTQALRYLVSHKGEAGAQAQAAQEWRASTGPKPSVIYSQKTS